MLVTVEELGQTELYPEIITKITRGSTTEAELQILTAEAFVKSYFSRYDTLAIFGDGTTAPTVTSELVKKLIKVVASWFLIRKANPNVNIDSFRADYEDVLDWLKDLQAGKVTPDLPYAPEDPNTGLSDGSDVYFTSNTKRTNSF